VLNKWRIRILSWLPGIQVRKKMPRSAHAEISETYEYENYNELLEVNQLPTEFKLNLNNWNTQFVSHFDISKEPVTYDTNEQNITMRHASEWGQNLRDGVSLLPEIQEN